MWVNGSLLQFIVKRGSQKNLISAEVMNQMGLPTTTHPQLYTIRWLHKGRYLHVNQQCHLTYIVEPFIDELLYNVTPLGVCDVLLGQEYLWKQHAMYESSPRAIIVTLGNNLYMIQEVAPPTTISFVTAKQCSKFIFKTEKFVFLMIAMTSKQGLSTRQQ